MSLASKLVVNYPWIPVLVLIPFCIIYDLYCFICLRINFVSGSSLLLRQHDEKVKHVQEQVRQWRQSGAKVPMCTARPGYKSITLQTLTYKEKLYKVEIDMPNILSIDTKNRLVRVEPMVTIGQLNNYLITQGWTLPVVPELDDLTVGGLVMGGGLETTSHKYGLFQHICKSYEMVLADGTKVVCSATKWPELYSTIPITYGTLGFLTAVEIDIIPYKPYIKLTYHPVHSLEEAVAVFKRETEQKSNDSVEGILYSLDQGVIMSGSFVSTYDAKLFNKIGYWFKPWFYKHVETFLSGDSGKSMVEYIPTYDFFHRHNNCCFWLLNYIIPFGNHPLFRWTLGWALPPKHAMIKLLKENFVPEKSPLELFVAQDFIIKIEDLKAFIEMVHKETAIWPLWLCPARNMVLEGLEHLSYFKREDLHIDLGLYGFSLLPTFEKVSTQRRMECFTIEHKAMLGLYAETQMTREEFEEMFAFSLGNYEKMRKELKCEDAFPHMYEKISKLGRK